MYDSDGKQLHRLPSHQTWSKLQDSFFFFFFFCCPVIWANLGTAPVLLALAPLPPATLHVCMMVFIGVGETAAHIAFSPNLQQTLGWFFAVPSSVPTSEALLCYSAPASLPPATPKTRSRSWPHPQRSTGGDVRSLEGCHPREVLHCCQSVVPVVIQHTQDTAPYW